MTAIATATGNRSHPARERGADLYQTPSEAMRTLLQLEAFSKTIWEPACGLGAIYNELHNYGCHVIASDLVDYGWSHYSNVDFLSETHAAARTMLGQSLEDVDIVTNPPFKIATKFIERAINLCPRVIMLLRVNALASCGRQQLINDHLARGLYFLAPPANDASGGVERAEIHKRYGFCLVRF